METIWKAILKTCNNPIGALDGHDRGVLKAILLLDLAHHALVVLELARPGQVLKQQVVVEDLLRERLQEGSLGHHLAREGRERQPVVAGRVHVHLVALERAAEHVAAEQGRTLDGTAAVSARGWHR